MAREGSETAAQREGSLWQDKPVPNIYVSRAARGASTAPRLVLAGGARVVVVVGTLIRP